MISFLLLLAAKSAIVLIAGTILSQLLRPAPAGVRHLAWVAVLGAVLVLPVEYLLPGEVVPESFTVRITSIPGTSGAGPARAPLITTMAVIWLLGSTLLVARLVLDSVRAVELVRRSERLPRTAGYDIHVTDRLDGPASWSFGSGAILMPRDATHWSEEEFVAAVRHESAHIQRHDSLWLLVAEVACAVYWFHPLVWYAARRLRIEQEHAADDLVLRTGLAPADYARQLVSLVRDCRRTPLFAGAGNGSMLRERVKAILDVTRRRSMVTRKMFAAALAAALVITLPLSALQAERKIHKIGGDVSSPKVIYKVEPQYTPEARDAKIEGAVLLSVVIDDTGTISDVRVVRGLDEGLDKNAVEALHEWQFQPAEKAGEPVAVLANVEVNFRLL